MINHMKIAKGAIEDVDVAIFFADDKKMRHMNKSCRQIDKTTDVLSVPTFKVHIYYFIFNIHNTN